MQIGIVGLGRMGGNIARRLLRHGHSVVGYNRNPDVARSIEGLGAAKELEELVQRLAAGPQETAARQLRIGNAAEPDRADRRTGDRSGNRRMARYLSDRFTVINYDRRGRGASGRGKARTPC